MLGQFFEKDVAVKQECTGYVDFDYVGDLDKRRSTAGYVFTLLQALVSGVVAYNPLWLCR